MASTSSSRLFKVMPRNVYNTLYTVEAKHIPNDVKHKMAIFLLPYSPQGTHWEGLGSKLGLPVTVLRYIRENYSIRCKVTYILDWFAKQKNGKIGQIVEALYDLGRMDVLQILVEYNKDIVKKMEIGRVIEQPGGYKCVFITYDRGMQQDHTTPRTSKQVYSLMEQLTNRGMLVFADEKSDETRLPDKSLKRFQRADYVLVFISCTYRETIIKQKTGIDVNAATFFQVMQQEYRNNEQQNNRFIPLLGEGVPYHSAPKWIREICIREIFYSMPTDLEKLVTHIKTPNEVEEQIMSNNSQKRGCSKDRKAAAENNGAKEMEPGQNGVEDYETTVKSFESSSINTAKQSPKKVRKMGKRQSAKKYHQKQSSAKSFILQTVRNLSWLISMTTGHTSSVPITLHTPFLEEQKDTICDSLHPSDELLENLFTNEIITEDNIAVIKHEVESLGKTKRMLMMLDTLCSERDSSQVISGFVSCLKQCNPGTNVELGKCLEGCIREETEL